MDSNARLDIIVDEIKAAAVTARGLRRHFGVQVHQRVQKFTRQ